MIEVKEETDGSFTISWDENDPVESMMNTWTEQDFIDAIVNRLERLKNETDGESKDIQIVSLNSNALTDRNL